jgi:hypothetical protein
VTVTIVGLGGSLAAVSTSRAALRAALDGAEAECALAAERVRVGRTAVDEGG